MSISPALQLIIIGGVTICTFKFLIILHTCITSSVAEPRGAATFSVEPEPIFYLAGAAFFKAAPAASFWQEKKESLVLLQNMT